jgi:hypothetical protein
MEDLQGRVQALRERYRVGWCEVFSSTFVPDRWKGFRHKAGSERGSNEQYPKAFLIFFFLSFFLFPFSNV